MNLSTTKMTTTVMSNLTSNLTNTSDFFGKQKKNGIPKYLNKNFEKIFFYNFFFLIFLARVNRNVATEPWFIGMMVSIVILIIIMVNVCILVRERGGKYSGK